MVFYLVFSKTDVEEIRSIDIVNVFKERAKLSNDELKRLGYNNEEIIKLRKIMQNAKVDLNMIINSGLSANLYLSLVGLVVNRSNFVFSFYFSWSSCPIIRGIDLIAFGWDATGDDGIQRNVAINTASSYITVRYKPIGNGVAINNVTNTFTAINGYHSAKVQFNEGINRIDLDTDYWADYGTGKLYLEAVASNSIYELLISIAYGHTILVGTPNVSISINSTSIGFNFNYACHQEAKITRRYRYDGAITTL